MGRPPSNGGPAFRFTPIEVAEMEAILQEHSNSMPGRDVLVGLADKFSDSPDRKGKITVQMKQVWNWFQNRRYAIRAKLSRNPGKLSVSSMPREDPMPMRNMPQSLTAPMPNPSVSGAGRVTSENSVMEFEAKSGRDGAWYDVANFFSHRYLDSGDPEVLIRFAGFGPEEDEWVNVKKHVRQRSLPCESSECVAVLPGDLILCFQEGKEQALYFDAHVLDAQRRRHDVRGCRCRFLVRYDHDQSEEIVPLRKVCRRPETDFRLQQLHAVNEAASAEQQKSNMDSFTVNALRANIPALETAQKQQHHHHHHTTDATLVTPVALSNNNASFAPQASSVLEPKKAETSNAVDAANSNTVPSGGNSGASVSLISNNTVISEDNPTEGK
ncbi:protein SAWADEE HOMEODOMAIN HOMOLOG 2 [Cannabis sativa]|uniref:protein SAWADEE HOMEODOMAIN HOMOLOG 2 n=1 Tax=Cannabis sativa TaxID=3483 RepID=UPI0029CA8955|nr:protein SAWADEE HOMEODOMAIN HOMOLOG 2 [Cannabis sativa]